jgi:hypothetical protein
VGVLEYEAAACGLISLGHIIRQETSGTTNCKSEDESKQAGQTKSPGLIEKTSLSVLFRDENRTTGGIFRQKEEIACDQLVGKKEADVTEPCKNRRIVVLHLLSHHHDVPSPSKSRSDSDSRQHFLSHCSRELTKFFLFVLTAACLMRIRERIEHALHDDEGARVCVYIFELREARE